MIGKRLMMLLGAGFIVTAAFSLTVSILDNGVGHTVLLLVHFVDPWQRDDNSALRHALANRFGTCGIAPAQFNATNTGVNEKYRG